MKDYDYERWSCLYSVSEMQKIEATFQDLQNKGYIEEDIDIEYGFYGKFESERAMCEDWAYNDGYLDLKMKHLEIEDIEEYIDILQDYLFHISGCDFIFENGYVFRCA